MTPSIQAVAQSLYLKNICCHIDLVLYFLKSCSRVIRTGCLIFDVLQEFRGLHSVCFKILQGEGVLGKCSYFGRTLFHIVHQTRTLRRRQRQIDVWTVLNARTQHTTQTMMDRRSFGRSGKLPTFPTLSFMQLFSFFVFASLLSFNLTLLSSTPRPPPLFDRKTFAVTGDQTRDS